MARHVRMDDKGLKEAKECLQSGGIIAYPTESAYGLGVLVRHPEAVKALARLGRLKNRPSEQSFPLLISSLCVAKSLFAPQKPFVWDLLAHHWPGGLTLVAPPRKAAPLKETNSPKEGLLTSLPPEVVSEVVSPLGVGLRVTGHPWTSKLVAAMDSPLTATSANLRGKSPTIDSKDLPEEIEREIDLVVDGQAGGDAVSTVVTPRAWGFQVLRQGAVDLPEELHITDDGSLRGKVRLFQPKKGYRFSVDALLLARQVEEELVSNNLLGKRETLTAVELGTGCGVVSLCLMKRLKRLKRLRRLSRQKQKQDESTISPFPKLHITAFEIQQRLAQLARLNVEENNFEEEITVILDDFTSVLKSLQAVPVGSTSEAPDAYDAYDALEASASPWGVDKRVDLVFSNPPFRRKGHGRVSPHREKVLASSEETCTLGDVVAFADASLKRRGLFCVVYSTERLGALMVACGKRQFHLERLRPVYPRKQQEANRFLATFMRGETQRSTVVAPPLICYEEKGNPTSELTAIMEGTD